jgi:hypothetical protein
VRNLKTVKIDIEYFEDERATVESLLWQLLEAAESFSSTTVPDREVFSDEEERSRHGSRYNQR